MLSLHSNKAIAEEWTSLVTCKPCAHGMWNTTVSAKECQSTNLGFPNSKKENVENSYSTLMRNFERETLDGTGGQQTDKFRDNCIDHRSQNMYRGHCHLLSATKNAARGVDERDRLQKGGTRKRTGNKTAVKMGLERIRCGHTAIRTGMNEYELGYQEFPMTLSVYLLKKKRLR